MLTKQELIQGFCDLLNVDLLELKCSYGTHVGIVVEPDDYEHDFSIGIQHITKSNTTFWLNATPRTERLLKASGLTFQDYKVTLSRYLVTI
jgi:hypothetical protein